MKATNNFVFSRRIVAFLCAIVLMVAMPTFTTLFSAGAEELPVMNLEEFDRWDADGWKIEKQSGVYQDADNAEHPYDYVMTVAEKLWIIVNQGVMRIGNVASRTIDFNLTTSTGIVVSGNPAITSSSWYVRTSTDESIATLKASSTTSSGRCLTVEPNQKVGQTVLTLTMNRVLDGEPVKGVLRILYNCVERETNKFTFTSLEKDRNNNKNAVWFNGINIPLANEEWTKAEEVGGLSVKEFYENIFFLESNIDGTPAGIETVELGVNDLRSIMSDKTTGALKFQTEVRSTHLEFKKQVRTMDDGGAGENGTPIDFEEGDAFFIKKGLYLMGQDGNFNWSLHETGFVFTELLRDQYFVYLGEDLGWSTDQLGMSIAFEENRTSVDVSDTITLNPIVSGGEALTPEQKAITWVSADEDIATVDQDGKVTGVAQGTTIITASTGTGDFAEIEVEVVATDEITSIRLNAANINLNIGGTRQIGVTVEGGTTADKSVTWSTSDSEVATVSEDGLVTAVGAGTCTITATASDGQAASANVTVRQGSTEPDDDDEEDTDDKKPGCNSTADFGGMAASAMFLGVGALLLVRRKYKQD